MPGDRVPSLVEKIPHAVGQLGLCTTILRLQPRPCALQKRSDHNEKAVHRNEAPLLASARASPRVATRPSAAKK